MNPDDTLPPSSAEDTIPPELIATMSTIPAPPPTDPDPDITVRRATFLPTFDLSAEELDEP